MGQRGSSADKTVTLHATTVALDGSAALICGASGAGKSGLALQLMAMGATLIADDRTILTRQDDQIIARAPEAIRGQIEARFVGLLAAPTLAAAPVRLIVDLDQEETERLPHPQSRDLHGVPIPVIRKSTVPHFPAAILLYLQGNRVD